MLSLFAAVILAQTPTIRIDLNPPSAEFVVVDREPGVYLGHVSTITLNDGSILAAYPKGHGQGPIVLKKSTDGGKTWSDRLPTPASWSTSKETPTLFNLGGGEVILFSGLHPIRASRSHDSGATWSELEAIGDFGGIVAMGDVHTTKAGRLIAYFHDDGRFFAKGGKSAGVFTVYQTRSDDRGATWSAPKAIWTGSEIHLCEPGLVKSPDGGALAMLLRENRRAKRSHVMFSSDDGGTWSSPVELPAELTGDRHTARYAKDGRLVITFRCMAKDDPWRGDWVAWVGRWEDIGRLHRPVGEYHGRPYLVRLKDNLSEWDCGYPGLEVTADGTLVATTYGTWTAGEKPSIMCVRFTTEALDALAEHP